MHNRTYRANPAYFKPPHLECTDLYETFRNTVKWSNNVIQDVILDIFFLIHDQEQSTSSKHGLQGYRVLCTLSIMLESCNLAYKSRITYHDDLWHQGWPITLNTWSGTINILQVWTSRRGGSWYTSNHIRELKFSTQVNNHIFWGSKK